MSQILREIPGTFGRGPVGAQSRCRNRANSHRHRDGVMILIVRHSLQRLWRSLFALHHSRRRFCQLGGALKNISRWLQESATVLALEIIPRQHLVTRSLTELVSASALP